MMLVIGLRTFGHPRSHLEEARVLESEPDQQEFPLPDEEELQARENKRTRQVVPLSDLGKPFLGALRPYAERITEVEVGYVDYSNLEFLRYTPNVHRVWVKSSSVKDISGLTHLRQLKGLSLDRPTCRMDVLGELVSLEELYLDNWNRGAESIFRLKNLRRVGIQKFPCPDLSPLENWQRLDDLWLNQGLLEDLRGIPASVKILRLTTLRRLRCIEEVRHCAGLEDLRLESCRKVTSVNGVEQCRDIRILCVINCGGLDTLEPLEGLPDLYYLVLVQHTITEDTQGVDALYTLPALETLIISRKIRPDIDRLRRTNRRLEVRLTP